MMIEPYINIVDHLKISVLDPATLGAVISGGSAILKGIGGLFQSKKGNKQLKKAVDPGYTIPEEFKTNLGIAENMARTGLPSQEYNLASTNIQRGTQAGLRQLGRMSNPFAGIAGLARGQSDSFSKLDAANAAARRQNILSAMGFRRDLAGQKLAKQQYAQERYFDKVNAANALIGAGRQNVSGALTSASNIGMQMMQGGEDGGGGGQSTPMSPTAMSTVSDYSIPQLTNTSSPSYYQMGNSGAMNFGSLSSSSPYSGFGFRKGK